MSEAIVIASIGVAGTVIGAFIRSINVGAKSTRGVIVVKNLIIIIWMATLLASCTSEREDRLINECRDEYYSRGVKDKTTGERLTPNSDVGIYLMIQDICRDKAELYAEGYRVEPFVEESDIPVFQLKGRGSLKQFHKEVLREME